MQPATPDGPPPSLEDEEMEMRGTTRMRAERSSGRGDDKRRDETNNKKNEDQKRLGASSFKSFYVRTDTDSQIL